MRFIDSDHTMPYLAASLWPILLGPTARQTSQRQLERQACTDRPAWLFWLGNT